MDAEWITSPTARRILVHWADPRPAWLWSRDGSTLIWHNAAARYFNAKIKKSGLKLAPEAVPIRGQVARLIRLGSLGRASLSRVQFLSGDKPSAATCSCTPVTLPDGETGLLLVGVDPTASDIRDAAGTLEGDAMTEALFPPGTEHRLVAAGETLPEGAIALKAGPDESTLLLFLKGVALPTIEDIRAEEGVSSDAEPDIPDLSDMPEPMLPLGLEPVPEAHPPIQPIGDEWVDPIPAGTPDRQLSSLFDRLAEDASLYTTLTAADEVFEAPAAEAATPPVPEEPDLIAAVIEYSDDPEDPARTQPPQAPASGPKSHWLITGRGFRALEPKEPESASPEPAPPLEPAPPPDPAALEPAASEASPDPDPGHLATVDAAPDAEAADRVSRYNFEELGRILSDRVAGEAKPEPAPATTPRPVEPAGVINLNAETLVLNRLPLAILVFRDQQVLFANRALTDLLGHDSVESLRSAGIGSIFPTDASSTGPVNRLLRRDGMPMPVAARLQSVSWQGRAALMLSASPGEPMRGHEGAVRAFAEIAAEAREEGFLVADRAGVLTQLSGHGAAMFGRPAAELVGKSLAILVSRPDMEPLRAFLEKPARFAETTRPHLLATSEDGEADITLFAEGQAGVVTGYFGFLKKRVRVAAPVPATEETLEPGLLGRLSRGIRRPLNTIVGFADMIRSAAFGSIDNERYVEYARDIRTAGLEIAVLVDELEDFTRLQDGRYAPRPSDVDLQGLLESSLIRIKAQAGAARVLVRSAISERLPRIHADRASLGQALLNLLASAVDQTPVGGSVILSAQAEEDGAIAIHVRDGAEGQSDLGERFVVFRDGVDRDGEQLMPVRSSVGLALTRSLLAVNACSLSVDPTAGVGTLFSMLIPAELVVKD